LKPLKKNPRRSPHARATPEMHYLDRFGATVPWQENL
jgi:hypothetical protein